MVIILIPIHGTKIKEKSNQIEEWTYMERLIKRIKPSYDLSYGRLIDKYYFHCIAKNKRYDTKYMLSKELHLWSVENNQLLFIQEPSQALTSTYLKQVETTLWKYISDERYQKSIDKYSSVNEHMSTTILILFVTSQPLSSSVKEEAMTYRKWKLIRFGLGGWIEAYVGVVDLQEKEIYIHKKGRDMITPLSLGFHIRS